MIAEADAAFAKGDYRSAKRLYTQALATATGAEREHVEKRLAALTVDKLALWLGAGTLTFIVVAYLLARFIA